MKELTDEEIENAAIKVCQNPNDVYRSAQGIGFIADAKFSRDHSPKFKTLEEIGWKKWGLSFLNCDTEFGKYQISFAGDTFCYKTPTSDKWIERDNIEICKQLAQSDYENRLKALLK